MIRRLLLQIEGGMMWSQTLRSVYQRYYGVRIGEFTYGAGIRPGAFATGTTIGRFCSIARGVEAFSQNHPTGRISQHPLFYAEAAGLLAEESIPEKQNTTLNVGNDVWLGTNALILPGCHDIGNGAIVGAGAIVTKNVPAFTIVAGSPARVIRKRFTPEVESIVAASEWWNRPLAEIIGHLDLFTRDLTPGRIEKFMSAFCGNSADPTMPERGSTVR